MNCPAAVTSSDTPMLRNATSTLCTIFSSDIPPPPRRRRTRLVHAARVGAERLELGAEDGGGAGHRSHLALGAGAGEVLHPAVGGDRDLVGRRVVERPAYSVGDQLGRLDLVVREVDDAEDDRLLAEVLQDAEVEP